MSIIETEKFRKLAGLAPTRPSLKEAVELHQTPKPEGNPPASYTPAPAVPKDGGEVGAGTGAATPASMPGGGSAAEADKDGGYKPAEKPTLPAEVGTERTVTTDKIEGKEDIEPEKPVIKEKECGCEKEKEKEKKEGITGADGYTVGSGHFKVGTITRVRNGAQEVKQADGKWTVIPMGAGPGVVGSGNATSTTVDVVEPHQGETQHVGKDALPLIPAAPAADQHTPVK